VNESDVEVGVIDPKRHTILVKVEVRACQDFAASRAFFRLV